MHPDRLRRLRRVRTASIVVFVSLSLLAAGLVERALGLAFIVWITALPSGALAFYSIHREEQATR